MTSTFLALSAIQNPDTRVFVTRELEAAGHRVIESSEWKQAHLLLINGLCPDLLIIDSAEIDSPSADHWQELLQSAPLAKTWLVSGAVDSISRQEACLLGITHFLNMPLTRDDVDAIVRAIQDTETLHQSGNKAPRPRSDTFTFESTSDSPGTPYLEELGDGRFFLASSLKMRQIYRQIEMLADTDVNVLILGESGTGKEIIARLLHKHSRRGKKTFLKVNCAAMPADLLESELFGHKQGAFTGAIRDLPGKFEQADSGTLFLDEIGEMAVPLQAKLLHVLEDGQFSRLGAQTYTKVDARVIAATNVQMEDALLQGTFREDLYYRLGVITITLPPLRERREDIPYLIEETIRRASKEMKTGRATIFSSRLLDVASRYDWPGNVRELRNFITRTIIMQDPDTALQQLEIKIAAKNRSADSTYVSDPYLSSSGMKPFVRDIKGRVEAKVIQDALERSGWNRRHAAVSLNISYRALLYKILQHRLVPNASGDPDSLYRNMAHLTEARRELGKPARGMTITP